MEKTAFLEKKINLTPKDVNRVKHSKVDNIILEKLKESVEAKCSEHGFVVPGTVKLISRSVGYYEAARFTGDAIYYVKAEAQIIYPVDGVKLIGEVIRKNKMGLYVVYKDAIRIQVPRDLHIGNDEYENVQIGDTVEVELKRSKFQINDLYILSSGIFIKNVSSESANTKQNIKSSIQQSRSPSVELLDDTPVNIIKSNDVGKINSIEEAATENDTKEAEGEDEDDDDDEDEEEGGDVGVEEVGDTNGNGEEDEVKDENEQ